MLPRDMRRLCRLQARSPAGARRRRVTGGCGAPKTRSGALGRAVFVLQQVRPSFFCTRTARARCSLPRARLALPPSPRPQRAALAPPPCAARAAAQRAPGCRLPKAALARTMPAPRDRRSFGAGSRRGGADGAGADGARSDTEALRSQAPNILMPVATAFLVRATARRARFRQPPAAHGAMPTLHACAAALRGDPAPVGLGLKRSALRP